MSLVGNELAFAEDYLPSNQPTVARQDAMSRMPKALTNPT
jgi:hypothetical protein